MKAYRKQIDSAEKQIKQELQNKQVPEPKVFSQNKEARVRFMQGIVADARVRQ
jgi:hypothetical protein